MGVQVISLPAHPQYLRRLYINLSFPDQLGLVEGAETTSAQIEAAATTITIRTTEEAPFEIKATSVIEIAATVIITIALESKTTATIASEITSETTLAVTSTTTT